MDFHRLSRRELQALCKRNKIPANMTNVAMADSLKSLQIVEGIDEFLQVCESEMAQASIESRMRSEVASPFMPPTGGRSTHMRNKETTVTSENKMDFMLKDCAHKGVLLTPVPKSRRKAVKEDSAVKKFCGTRRSARLAEKSARLRKGIEDGNTDERHQVLTVNLKESLDESEEVSGVTDVSERVNMEENSEKKDEEQVDSDEKQDIATAIEENKNHFNTDYGDKTDTKEHSNEKTHIEVFPCEKEVVTTVEEVHLVPKIQEIKNNQSGAKEEAEMGQKEHSLAEIKERGAGLENSDLPGVDAITTAADNSEQKAHEEVVQCEKKVVSVEDVKQVITLEGEKSASSRADDAKTELKDTEVEIEQEGCGSEIDAKTTLRNTAVESEQDDCGSEIDGKKTIKDTDVENEQENCGSNFDGKTELKDTDVEIELEDSDSDIDTEFDAKTELKDPDVEIEQGACGSEIDTEFDAKIELKDPDIEIEQEGNGSEIDAGFHDTEVSETDTGVKDNTSIDASTDVESEDGMHEYSSETASNLNESDSDSSETESNLNDSDSSETKSTESSYSLAVMASDNYTIDEEVLVIEESKEIGGAIDRPPSVEAAVDDDHPPPINVLTPIRASASNTSSMMQQRMAAAAASDNKENICSESKTKTNILIKDIKEAAINLYEMGQLSKKFEEVCLTPKLDKNERVDEVSARPALQLLPHNQKIG